MFPLFLVILFIWSYAQAAYERGGQEMVSSNIKTMTNNSTKLTPKDYHLSYLLNVSQSCQKVMKTFFMIHDIQDWE